MTLLNQHAQELLVALTKERDLLNERIQELIDKYSLKPLTASTSPRPEASVQPPPDATD